MSSTTTVYLISGANRGIGLALVALLAARDDVVVFAGARNPDAAEGLKALVKQFPGKVHILKLTSGVKSENEAAAEYIQKTAGHLDVVIANAGIGKYLGTVHETPVEEMRDHYEASVNVIGTVVLYQAVYSLLKASPSPKFVGISSMGGSVTIGPTIPFGLFAYGATKAALNWFTRKVHHENENFISFSLHPGAVATDMLHYLVEATPGADEWPSLTVEESANSMVAVIDKATREETGGTFLNYDGGKLAW
ncbi:hypothetical protein PLICRDRAFT_113403 [Plicaturopsis crispa FD-325 SS-3]|nr:hypothetical protein PLICRDRAFT_113403 [Plicaturopsis crispa FD-325 SS-3]